MRNRPALVRSVDERTHPSVVATHEVQVEYIAGWPHPDWAPRAAYNPGLLLEEQGDRVGGQSRLPAGHRQRARRGGAQRGRQPRAAAQGLSASCHLVN